MLSIEECEKILNKNGGAYNIEEIKSIKDFVFMLAEFHLSNQKDNINDKKSGHLHSGFNGHSG